MNNVKAIQRLNQAEARLGIKDKLSWHAQYKDSAYIFVGGLDYRLTEGDVLAVFSQYGEIVNINLVRDKKTGKSKGFCFLAYQDQRSTILAVDNLNGAKVCGRTIRVDHVREYRRPKDENGEEIVEKGCAPKTPTPSPVSSPAPSPSPPPKKKAKKKKKDKSKDKEKSSALKGSSLEKRDVKEVESKERFLGGGGSEGRKEGLLPGRKGLERESQHRSSREDRWERLPKDRRQSPAEREQRGAEREQRGEQREQREAEREQRGAEREQRGAESRHRVSGGRDVGIRMEDRKRGYGNRSRSDSDSSGAEEGEEQKGSRYQREGKARYMAGPSRHRSRSPDRQSHRPQYRQHRSDRH